jgi:hypothetical protein
MTAAAKGRCVVVQLSCYPSRPRDSQSWVTEMTLNAPDIPASSPAAALGVCRSLFTKTSAAGSYQISQLTVPSISGSCVRSPCRREIQRRRPASVDGDGRLARRRARPR